MMIYRRHRFGVTLLELLVVLVILATLIGVLLPVAPKVRDRARTPCNNNSVQIALAGDNYQDSFQVLPPRLDTRGVGPLSRPLPHPEQDNPYKGFSFRRLSAPFPEPA